MAARHACWFKGAGHASGHAAMQSRLPRNDHTCAEKLMPLIRALPRTPDGAVEDMMIPRLLRPSPPSANDIP
eukprot:13433051-Alexandrium_andersonii.AAC.1